MVCCSQYAAIHAQLTYHKAHRELSDRLEAAGVEEQEDMAMIPVMPEAMTLRTNLQELREDHQALAVLQSSETTALQNENTVLQAKIKSLEGAAKKQSILTKALEARLNKLESAPPAYGVPSVTRPDKKTL